MESDCFPLHGIVVLLGILVNALYFASTIKLRRYVRMRSLVGMGFVIGGVVFFTTISWPALHDDYPGWLPATGIVAGFDASLGEHKYKRTLVAFHNAVGSIAEAWLTIRKNDLWDAVPGPADEEGGKNLRKAVLHIQYDPKNPADIVLRGVEPWKLLLGGSIFGGVFVPVGLFLLVRPCLDLVRRVKLGWSGTRSTARIIDIRQDRNYAIRTGKWMPLHFPWIIRAEWVDPKTEGKCVLESGAIWTDPQPLVDIGSPIDVLVDYAGPQIVYAVDTRPFGVKWEAKIIAAPVPKKHHKP